MAILTLAALAISIAIAWPAAHGHGASLRPGSEYGEEHEATRLVGSATCGRERWPVKTLTDADASKVRFTPVHTVTVGYLGSLPRLGAWVGNGNQCARCEAIGE